MIEDARLTPTNPAIICLASYDKRRAPSVLLIALAVLASVFLFAVYEIITGGMSGTYGWKLPLIAILALALIPYLVRNLRNCLRGLPMIYIEGEKLIVFDARNDSIKLQDIARFDVSPKSNAVRISGNGKPRDIRLLLASDRPETVVARFHEATALPR